jgi:hypothetical protein
MELEGFTEQRIKVNSEDGMLPAAEVTLVCVTMHLDS